MGRKTIDTLPLNDLPVSLDHGSGHPHSLLDPRRPITAHLKIDFCHKIDIYFIA